MPFDPGLAERLEEAVAEYPGMKENRMMGGFGYLLNGNMCVGIHKDSLIIRVGVEAAEKILTEPHVRPMDFTDSHYSASSSFNRVTAQISPEIRHIKAKNVRLQA